MIRTPQEQIAKHYKTAVLKIIEFTVSVERASEETQLKMIPVFACFGLLSVYTIPSLFRLQKEVKTQEVLKIIESTISKIVKIVHQFLKEIAFWIPEISVTRLFEQIDV